MLPTNLWEHQAPMKALYAACVEPVCKRHRVTRTELDILLFLANNPQYDTAADVVEVRYLAKSHVSVSVKALVERGFMAKGCCPGDRRTVRLRILPAAAGVIADGRRAQARFTAVLLAGLDGEELHTLGKCFERILENIRRFMEEGGPC